MSTDMLVRLSRDGVGETERYDGHTALVGSTSNTQSSPAGVGSESNVESTGAAPKRPTIRAIFEPTFRTECSVSAGITVSVPASTVAVSEPTTASTVPANTI